MKICHLIFTQKHAHKIAKLENELYCSVDNIGKVTKKWLKTATKEEIQLQIDNCKIAIECFESLKRFCYKKSKGGIIYFQDMWEYCHNSKNSCFTYIQSTIELKQELEGIIENQGKCD